MIRRRDPWPLLAVAVVLLWPFPYVAPIRPPNELTRAYQVRAIVEEGTLAIDGQIARHGAVFDLSTYSGGTYPNKAPGVSLLGAPVWAAWVALSGREDASLAETLFVLEKVLLALPTLLLLIFLRRWLARFTDNRWAVELAVLAWALGSVSLPYALLLYGHQLAAVLLMGGFLFYVRGTETSRGAPYVLGGLLSGLAVLTEYTVAPAVLVTGLYALLAGPTGRRPRVIARRLGLVLGGAAPALAALLW